MTIAIVCLLVAALLPYATVGIAKWDKSFDNNNPRDWLAEQHGVKRRAHAAHLNHFEAFAPFAAGVIVAAMVQVAPSTINALAVAFVLLRVAYTWAYITDRATIRTVIWIAAAACTLALFVLAALK